MSWNPGIPQGNESQKIKYEIVPYTRGYGLDLGCSIWKPYSHMIGVDVYCSHCGQTRKHLPGCPGAWHINLFHIADKLPLFATASLDFVYSSHLLEHMHNPLEALKEWWRIIKHGGHLVLYLPHADLYPNTPEEGGNPEHKHNFRPKDIIELMKQVRPGWDLLVSEVRDNDTEYSFLQVYKKLATITYRFLYSAPRPAKTCLVVRYGAVGDMIQTSSVLAVLKKLGYHVTMNTTERGKDILLFDPNIDDWLIQDDDQVPNTELPYYWEALSKKYDKFVNLSETVEGTLLAMPGRALHAMPKSVRHRLTNINYLEFMHQVAEIPYEPNVRFYPSKDEANWARREKAKIGAPVLLWALSGSSVHKAWPYQDALFARILLSTDWHIVTVGDSVSQMLEVGWEKEPRVHMQAGKWSMRQTLAFAQVADMVAGPETGVLNAVSFENVPKILFLSHSTVENLSRDWINVVSLVPEGCSCYPCHMMHYGFKFCKRNEETGVAECQARIDLENAWRAFLELKERTEVRKAV